MNLLLLLLVSFVYGVNDCVVGGCSMEQCHEPGLNVVSACIWADYYECYKIATCARTADNKCHWLMNSTLRTCFERTNAPVIAYQTTWNVTDTANSTVSESQSNMTWKSLIGSLFALLFGAI
jgi:eight-cysteine-cluster-containing protein